MRRVAGFAAWWLRKRRLRLLSPGVWAKGSRFRGLGFRGLWSLGCMGLGFIQIVQDTFPQI